LRSAPIRFLLLDEVDAYPDDCGGEGSPITLAEVRTRTFKRNKKICLISSPKTKNKSHIEKAFDLSDKRYFNVPCPLCGHKQKLTFDRLRWNKGDPESVLYFCVKCENGFHEGYKNQILAAGQWIATQKSVNPKTIGFHLNALYSPLGWYSWADIASDWEEAQGDVLKLKTFVNTVLGETWQEKGEAPAWEKLHERKSQDYFKGEIPNEVSLLTAGVDVQQDRLEVEIVGWGRNLNSWSIDYIKIFGNPVEEEVWQELHKILNQDFISLDGRKLNISKMAVDSGNMTQTVYNFVYHAHDHRLIAIKGKATGQVIIEPARTTDLVTARTRLTNQMRYYPIATGLAKEELYNWLFLKKPKEGDSYPRGYCHFPGDYDEEYFKQLTAEDKQKIERASGVSYTWQKNYERNEALDVRVYARAAAYLLLIDKFTDQDWQILENSLLNDRDKITKQVNNIMSNNQTNNNSRKSSDFW
jgi:phage terminase large subunit GpA-like protein